MEVQNQKALVELRMCGINQSLRRHEGTKQTELHPSRHGTQPFDSLYSLTAPGKKLSFESPRRESHINT